MFRSQWLVILSQYLSFLHFPSNFISTRIIKKQAPIAVCVIQRIRFFIKNLLHSINRHGCKNYQLLAYHSPSDERQHEPFDRLKLVLHHVVAVKGDDHNARWYFHNARTRFGRFLYQPRNEFRAVAVSLKPQRVMVDFLAH
jgi:hypothetical protein